MIGYNFLFNKKYVLWNAVSVPLPIANSAPLFIQLSPTLMKLCLIKCDYPVHIVSAKCPPSVKTHAGIF